MKFFYCIIILFSTSVLKSDKNDIVSDNFFRVEKQYSIMLKAANDLQQFPKTINKDGSICFTGIGDWTCGFWPGCLWQVFEYSKEDNWKQEAIKWTESLEKNQYNTESHDIGFVMNCSYGNAFRLTGNVKYKNILVQSAKSLVTRFNPKVGALKSWNIFKSWNGKSVYQYPVIIDNMMNLELLFNVYRITGDSLYRNVAIKHAETTMKNHYRDDFSSYHVICYDPETGKVLSKETAQGFSDNSAWARGQAWGLYGFTMVYRETKDMKYLLHARFIADFYLSKMETVKGNIPFWDFNVNQLGFTPNWRYEKNKFSEVPHDASAAAIISSALFELSTYVEEDTKKKYFNAAYEILKALSSDYYRAELGTNGNFLLKHSVGSIPHNAEIDVPLIYADYYFLEALLRYEKISKNKK